MVHSQGLTKWGPPLNSRWEGTLIPRPLVSWGRIFPEVFWATAQPFLLPKMVECVGRMKRLGEWGIWAHPLLPLFRTSSFLGHPFHSALSARVFKRGGPWGEATSLRAACEWAPTSHWHLVWGSPMSLQPSLWPVIKWPFALPKPYSSALTGSELEGCRGTLLIRPSNLRVVLSHRLSKP